METFEWGKYFDKIFCLSLSDYKERREDEKKELERIGINTKSDYFEWKYTTKNYFYQYIWDNQNLRIDKWWKNNISALNCTLGHYEILKEAQAMGFEKILILEDDVRFLKDTQKIYDTIAKTPEYDICNYGGNINPYYGYPEKYFKLRENDKGFYDFSSIIIIGMECIGLSKRAIDAIIKFQEIKYQPADHYTNLMNNPYEAQILGTPLKRIAPNKQIALQNATYRYNEEGYNYTMEKIYGNILDFDDYNIDLKK